MNIRALLSVAPILAAPATPLQDEGFGPRTTTIAGREAVLPLDLSTGHAIVQVEIDGLGPFPLLFDTGASATTLDRDLAEELGLPVVGETTGGDPSDPSALTIELVVIPTLTLGAASFEEIIAGSWNRPRSLGGGATRGILGLPTFEDCLLTIDYEKRELRIARGKLAPADGDPNIVALRRSDTGLISVPLRLPSGREIDAHLDTGNQSSVFVPAELEAELNIVEGSRREGAGARASGNVTFLTAQLDGNLTVGPLVMHNPEIRFDSKMDHANLGLDFFRRAQVTIDLANERMRILPFAVDAAEPAEKGAPRER